MTPAPARPIAAPTAPVTTSGSEPREARSKSLATSPTGWYDPDGAAWEAESPASVEAFRSSPIRPPLRVDGVDSDLDN